MSMAAVQSIIRHEGFRPVPYPDPIHGWEKPTFGHGLTYITEKESADIVAQRVRQLEANIKRALPWTADLPQEAIDVLVEMAYQMGVTGLLRFRRMLDALKAGDFETAADEMLNSRWARQTPGRADELSQKMRGLHYG